MRDVAFVGFDVSPAEFFYVGNRVIRDNPGIDKKVLDGLLTVIGIATENETISAKDCDKCRDRWSNPSKGLTDIIPVLFSPGVVGSRSAASLTSSLPKIIRARRDE